MQSEERAVLFVIRVYAIVMRKLYPLFHVRIELKNRADCRNSVFI